MIDKLIFNQFKILLSEYDKITILTHKNPDGDTLGTGLGIYGLLKNAGKQVEICNLSRDYPNNLDFLAHFAKIKNRIDFNNSLIISCDSGSIDLLGFNLSSRKIVNIDHHKFNSNYGTLNIIDSTAVSASMVAYELFKDEFEITADIATCFYVALVTDTQYFVTLNVNADVFSVASELISCGIQLNRVNRNLTQRKSLASFRLLSNTLDTLNFTFEAQVASMVVSEEVFLRTGAKVSDLIGIIDQAMALATVKIAILVIELESNLKVSFRSDAVDILELAIHFGGGGHALAAGFSCERTNVEELLETINKEIKKRGLIYGT